MFIRTKTIQFIKEKYYLILFLIPGFFIYGFINEKIWVEKMLKNPRYTIGVATTDWHQKNNNGVGTDYKYYLKKVEHLGTTNYSYKKGYSFLIIFDSLKPKNNKALGFYNIENYLLDLNIPDNGWKYNEVPFNIDSLEIRNKLTE